jgi:hypothetical protein
MQELEHEQRGSRKQEAGNKAGSLTDLRLEIAENTVCRFHHFFQYLLGLGLFPQGFSRGFSFSPKGSSSSSGFD